MKIAILSTLDSGGASVAAYRLTKALCNAGYNCTFFVLENTTGALDHKALNQVPDENRFYVPTLFDHWHTLSSDETRTTGKCELFSDQTVAFFPSSPLPQALLEADVIHLHWVAGILFSPLLLDILAGKKIVWTLHDTNAFTGGCHYHISCRKFETQCSHCPMLVNSHDEDISSQIFKLKKQIYQHISPTIITPSKWLQKEAESSSLLKNKQIECIPNCINTKEFHPYNQIEARKIFGLNLNSFVILIGCEHLNNPRKNIGMVLDSITMLVESYPESSIEVVTFGHGNIGKLPYPVHSVGYIHSEEKMALLYNASDIYIHSALLDNLPNTCCEAQCCGLPVLCFNAGGTAETIIPGETGFISYEYTSKSLYSEIKKILGNQKKLKSIRFKCSNFAHRKFDESYIVKRHIELYKNTHRHSNPLVPHNIYSELTKNSLISVFNLQRSIDKHTKIKQNQLEIENNQLHKANEAILSKLSRRPYRLLEKILSCLGKA